jgi:HK97 family phage major capsid protein
MNFKAMRAAALKAAREIAAKALADGRDLSDEEQSEIQAKMAEIADLDAKIKAQEDGEQLLKQLDGLAPKDHEPDGGDAEKPAKSLGDHFVKSVGSDGLSRLKAHAGMTVSAPEFKAATDAHATPAAFTGTVLEQVDTTLVRGYRRPTVADLFAPGAISGTSIRYFVEAGVEGGFATVAEGGQKPQLHIADPTPVVDSVKKLAAWWDMDDEMVEDLAFWVSEINNRGLYMLSLKEEDQLLNGDGVGSNIDGVLHRSGVQQVSYDAGKLADGVFKAMTAIQTVTGLSADAVVIHPTDYQELRLNKDGNGQYYGGGYFAGQYGNGAMALQPQIWGLSTVVSPAVAAGKPVVGAFKQAATVYRKGGVKVDATNSDQGKFTKDIVTTRVEERIALAVRVPAAVAQLSVVSGG